MDEPRAKSSAGGVGASSRREQGGIVNLSGRGMLVVSVARQLGSGNSFARLLCCPAQAEWGRKWRPGSAKLTMPFELRASVRRHVTCAAPVELFQYHHDARRHLSLH